MFTFKKEYFFIIENIKDINLSNKKKGNKFNIIYRSKKKNENIKELEQFRRICKQKGINFFISNNLKLISLLKADGIYISAFNKDLSINRLKNLNLKIIGSAHNIRELKIKNLQGCKSVFFSRLFKTSYLSKPEYFGLIKFNLFKLKFNYDLVPLGGIRLSNLNKLKITNCKSFAILSEVKKKPAITSRLF